MSFIKGLLGLNNSDDDEWTCQFCGAINHDDLYCAYCGNEQGLEVKHYE